ncbi:ABC transporter ATP-binding protein [Alloalcanivorax xenomutans]|uniref:ABC transporter ATP-binding protein n=1 Tax=Alloalcanivorax xenomutans TaxID=1094342 RepID=UPI00292F0CD7|nr:ABC transporter ATP-binding protein [Alloalcanivorax xenomutans]WOA32010.1 ABC transporter ATP-binding protein [Alloalcanivorax xenomutans]WOD28977.1 ABC transporter ATP-binding protein [Alloalcanivorax xenomutans]
MNMNALASSPINNRDNAVSVDDLVIHFHTRAGTVKAVDGVSFDIRPGETFGIIGESGSGKTTLGRALAGLLKATDGHIRYQGREPAALSKAEQRQIRRDYQIIFQDPHAALNPRMTILQSVMEPMEILRDGDARQRQRVAKEALERVGLPAEIGKRYPHELSGGQKQRVNIARTLTLKPRFIVCDEVVAALDVSIRGSVLNLFADLQKELGITYAFITHDISVVSHVSDRVGVLYLGRLMEVGPAAAVTEKPIHPYTQALLSAEPLPLPSDQRDQRRAIRLQGEIPSPLAPPSGCRFRTRCPAAQSRCAEQEPAWREVAPEHWVACHFADSEGGPLDREQSISFGRESATETV